MPVRIIDSLAATSKLAATSNQDAAHEDAARLVFEYMALTQGEAGRPIPAAMGDLPSILRSVCENVAGAHAAPGTVLVAYRAGESAGCVGLKHLPRHACLEVTRLYVRPAHRGRGIARALMAAAHLHATAEAFDRTVLSVLPARTHVVEFYRRLGYRDCEPFADWARPLVFMDRVVSAEVLPAAAPAQR